MCWSEQGFLKHMVMTLSGWVKAHSAGAKSQI